MLLVRFADIIYARALNWFTLVQLFEADFHINLEQQGIDLTQWPTSIPSHHLACYRAEKTALNIPTWKPTFCALDIGSKVFHETKQFSIINFLLCFKPFALLGYKIQFLECGKNNFVHFDVVFSNVLHANDSSS